VPAPLGTATLEISPFAITAGRAAVPFLAVSGRSPVLLPSYATPLPRRSGLTLDLSTTAVPSLLPPSSAAPPPASVALPAPESTGRDRRTEAGTVALDPSQLDALFGRKPQK
jgi:hypothetical protein